MHTCVGRYQLHGQAGDVSRLLEQGLIPLLCQQDGFRAYWALDTGNGTFVTVAVFADRAGAEAGDRLASDWIARHLAALASRQDSMSGAVMTHAGSWG
jgi:hypothetical protein